MIDDRSSRSEYALGDSFERYLQDKGKGRSGDGGNYRRNAARELERFAEWAAGDRGRDDWAGIVPDDVDQSPVNEPDGHRRSNRDGRVRVCNANRRAG